MNSSWKKKQMKLLAAIYISKYINLFGKYGILNNNARELFVIFIFVYFILRYPMEDAIYNNIVRGS